MKRLRTLIVVLLSLLVGGVFVVAGVLKGLDVDGFARDIMLHGIIGPGLSAVAARVLVPFEIVLGAAAIIGYRRRTALVLLILTLVFFVGATGWAWAKGNTEGCGCFGRYASRTPLAVIVEDLLLVLAGVLALVVAGRPARAGETARPAGADPAVPAAAGRAPASGKWKGAVVALLAVVSTAFALASPRLPLDDFATALRPGVTLRELGLDQIAGNLAEGDRLLVVLVLDEKASQDAVPWLNALAQFPGVPPISGLTSAPEEKRTEFLFSHAPSFELLAAPAPDLRRLYRRAPRAFRVHNGQVIQVWQGIPPVEGFAQ